jgi:Uncharacterised protein family UPF0547
MHDQIEVNRAGIGLTIVGAVLMVIAVFLPRVESQQFFRVADNTLIQSGDGWVFVGLAVIAAAATYRTYQQQSKTWTVLVLGLLGIALAIYEGTGERLVLTSLADNSLFNSVRETASPGVGIYAAGAGSLLVAYGGALLAGWGIWPGGSQLPARRTKQCPDCAETVLADARVCKHCGYQFGNGTARAERTASSSTGGTAWRWRCDLCNAQFETREAAEKHAENDHIEMTTVEAKNALHQLRT